MTVAQLIKRLSELPPDWRITVLSDDGMATEPDMSVVEYDWVAPRTQEVLVTFKEGYLMFPLRPVA